MIQDISYELEYLGFTKNEVRVYLTLLRIGETTAGKLAKEAGLERTSTYNALNRLIKEGIVSYVIESSEKVFSPGKPESILGMIKEKEERAKLLIPKIASLAKYEKEKEHIQKFKGYAGIKTVLNDILNSCKQGEEYLVFGTESQISERLPVYAEIYVARKDKKKLKARMLIRESLRKTGHKKSKYTEVRYVPANIRSFSNINVYGNKVAILTWGSTPEAIIIDNKDNAETFRGYFEFMWQNAEK
jgi:sugar-specific transcriptional regulator TrmB